MLKRRRQGMSLVEIMVVVMLMAILSSAVAVTMGRSGDKAKFARAESDLKMIHSAFLQYYNSVGDFSGLVSGNLNACGLHNTGLQTSFSRPLDDILDPWGNQYRVASSYNNNTGLGAVIVYVVPHANISGSGATGTVVNPGLSGAANVTATAARNRYNSDKPMASIVYAVE